MNKRGLSTLMNVIIGFTMFSLVFMFTMVFILEAGETYLIEPTQQIGLDVVSDLAVNNTQSESINNLVNDFKQFSFPYDLFFLFMWISYYVTTVVAAFKSNKEGFFSFFGFIFIGSLVLLLITSYMSNIAAWFMSEIFNTVFGDVTLSLSIFNFYISNLGIINFIWWLSLVMIAVIDKSFISKSGEVEE